MMAKLMSETCWAHKKWNKITSDIKLVVYSSTIPVYVQSIMTHKQYCQKIDPNSNKYSDFLALSY